MNFSGDKVGQILDNFGIIKLEDVHLSKEPEIPDTQSFHSSQGDNSDARGPMDDYIQSSDLISAPQSVEIKKKFQKLKIKKVKLNKSAKK